MFESMGSFVENYSNCFLGVNLLAVAIMLLRKFVGKKVSKCFSYSMWIVIPLFMSMVSFIKLPVPQFVDVIITNNTVKEVHQNMPHKGHKDLIGDFVEESGHVTKIKNDQKPTVPVPEIMSKNEMMTNVETHTESIDIMSIIVNVYIVVVILIFTGMLFVNGMFSKQCKKSRAYVCLSAGMGIPVYELENISSPFLMGRTIYIPQYMEEDDEIRYAIIHEETHFKHGDSFWVILRYLILAIYFYNPIIWLAFKYSGYDCELACDEEVIKTIRENERKRYGGCLLNAIETKRRLSASIIMSTNMKSGKKLIRERIENIANRGKNSFLATFLAAVMLVTVVGCSLMDSVKSYAAELAIFNEVVNSEQKFAQSKPTNTGVVNDKDTVQVCSEIWIRSIDEEEGSYEIIEGGRELEFVVGQDTTEFTKDTYGFSKEIVKKVVKSVQGRTVGDVILQKEIQGDTEYYYYFTILGINDTHAASYQLPQDWNYRLAPVDIKEFYLENGEESESGYLYGFGEDFITGFNLFYSIASASSTLEPQGEFAYSAKNMTGGSRNSTWSEGVEGDGIGEYIEVRQLYMRPDGKEFTFDKLCIVNGYAENEKKWKENGRVKLLKFYYEDAYMGTITLEDTINPQYIDLTPLNMVIKNGREATFRFEIAEVYQGTKYDDTCITGIEIGFAGKE